MGFNSTSMRNGDEFKTTLERLNTYISTYIDNVTEEEQKALQGLLPKPRYLSPAANSLDSRIAECQPKA